MTQLKEKAQVQYHTDDVKIFTFVRDPLSHFLSGLVESHYRAIAHGNKEAMTPELAHDLASNQVNSSLARTILYKLISGVDTDFTWNILVERAHFQLQSYALIEWQPDAIGYLEYFEDDWQYVNEFLGLNISFMYRNNHITSQDPMNLKRSLLEVLNKFPKFMRGVCRLLMVDYVCLRYPLPKECAHMNYRNSTSK